MWQCGRRDTRRGRRGCVVVEMLPKKDGRTMRENDEEGAKEARLKGKEGYEYFVHGAFRSSDGYLASELEWAGT